MAFSALACVARFDSARRASGRPPASACRRVCNIACAKAAGGEAGVWCLNGSSDSARGSAEVTVGGRRGIRDGFLAAGRTQSRCVGDGIERGEREVDWERGTSGPICRGGYGRLIIRDECARSVRGSVHLLPDPADPLGVQREANGSKSVVKGLHSEADGQKLIVKR